MATTSKLSSDEMVFVGLQTKAWKKGDSLVLPGLTKESLEERKFSTKSKVHLTLFAFFTKSNVKKNKRSKVETILV